MKKARIIELKRWLQIQIDLSDRIMKEAQNSCNYGKEALYEGMVNAYKQCLSQIG